MFVFIALLILMQGLCASAAEVTIYVMEVPPVTIDAKDRHGMMGDVVAEAVRRSGLDPKFVVVPSPRALAQVPNMVDTLIIPLARIPDREQQYIWIAPVMRLERAFYSLGRSVKTFEEARDAFQSIAVSRGTAGLKILQEKGFRKQQLIEVNQGDTAPKMLLGGRVDAWYNPILEARWLLSEFKQKTPLRSPPLGPTDQYLACSKICDAKLVERLSKTLKAMEADGSSKKLMSLYGYDD